MLRQGLLALILLPATLAAQQALPLRQSSLDAGAADPAYRVPLDSTADDRWLGGSGLLKPRWDVAGDWVYFQFDTSSVNPGDLFREAPWWRVSRDGSRIEAVSRRAALAVPRQVSYTRDGDRAVYFHEEELRYWERGKRETRLLVARQSPITPAWSPDEREVRFADGNVIYAIDPVTGVLRQLTRIVSPPGPRALDANAAELERQQLELFDFLKDRDSLNAFRDARDRQGRVSRLIPVPTTNGERIQHLQLSPDDRWITLMAVKPVSNRSAAFVEFVNKSGYVQAMDSRPKVGAEISARRVGIVRADPTADPDSVEIVWVDTADLGKPVTATNVLWNPQGTRLVVEYESIDYKDSWILLVAPETGRVTRVLDHQHDPAWLGGPKPAPGRHEGGWIRFLPDGERIAVVHEDTGWAHLYLIDMEGRKRALTTGEWEVTDVALSADGSRFWVVTSREHPGERHLYMLPAEGGELARIDGLGEGEISVTLGRGYEPSFSPDERVVAYTYGKPDELRDIYIQPARPGAAAVRVTRSGTDAFHRIAWSRNEYVRFVDDQGRPVWMRVYLPAEQHPKRPAVIEVHGAGYAQAVRKSFGPSSAHGGPLYAQYLTERGFVYVVLDYLGSSGYGRDARTSIYRDMGGPDVGSAVAAIRILEQRYGVDPARVGIYGVSYGGFLTLMALFKHPGTFAAGVAQSAVADWAHYDHSYTARILNGAPAHDTAAYRASSPIWHAEGLEDPLMIQHGLLDWNVHYQDAVRLAQRLIELGKDFDLVTYPIEEHSWVHPASQRDSQRRMTRLWEMALLGERVNGSDRGATTAGVGDGSAAGNGRAWPD